MTVHLEVTFDGETRRVTLAQFLAENEGASVGGKPCSNAATHRVLIAHDGDDYESFLCPECFTGFREEMVKSGMPPRNEGVS